MMQDDVGVQKYGLNNEFEAERKLSINALGKETRSIISVAN